VARVETLKPDIDVVKTALVGVVLDPDAAAVGGPDVPDPRPAAYTYEVTNTGNVELSLAAVPPDDSHCEPLTFVEGDVDTDGLLDVDETWLYECTATLEREQGNSPPVTGAESGLVENEVEVTGVPFFEGALVPDKAVTASDTAQVQVIEPGITIVKAASAPVVLAGGAVTYTFLVANTGDVGLEILGPVDDKCSPLTFVGGDRPPANGLLEGANSGTPEVWTFRCTRPIPTPEAPATTDLNTVTVAAVDPLGNLYTAEDTAEVRVFDPAIDLVKTVSDDLVLSGTEVTYGFEVRNVGASPLPADDVLAEIELVDTSEPAVPSCTSPTFVDGDTNGDGLLDREPAEVWTYECAATITAPTTDAAVVRGTGGTTFTPPLPVDVFDVDAAFVRPFTPGIEVTKSASPTLLVGSGPVTYTYLVRNTGDVPLAGVAERITDDTCSPVTYVSGDQDGDGLLDSPISIFEDALDETWTFTCTTTIDATTTNTVVVNGTPTDGGGEPLCADEGPVGEAVLQTFDECEVLSDSVAAVTVVDPGAIVIGKQTTVGTGQGFDFTMGDATFSVGAGSTHTVGDLAPGVYTVTEAMTSGWVTQSISCTDATGNTMVAVVDRRATIDVAEGETVTCTFTNRFRGPLPSTGNTLQKAIGAGALLLIVGATLVALQRQRRTATR
jgi:archaellum component FlaG (FlaF/FlaG flagellin family)